MTVYQISIFLENRTGQLAEIAKILADNQIDMRAISIAETSDYGVLCLFVPPPPTAAPNPPSLGVLPANPPASAGRVCVQPGGLAPVLQLIADGEIDIEYMYSLFTHKEGNAYMVFRVSDDEKFTSLLAQNGIKTVTRQELDIGD